MIKIKNKNNQGISLIATIFIMIGFSILGLIGISLITNTSVESLNSLRTSQAFFLAEAGLQQAYYNIKNGDDSNIPETNLGKGTFSVGINETDTDTYEITSTGTLPISAETDVTRVITSNLTIESSSPFSYSIIGDSEITMDGNSETDSYDSSLGSYGGANKGSEGDIGTNGTGTNVIKLKGNAKVQGNASTGEGGTVKIKNNAEVTGDITDDFEQELQTVEVPSNLTDLSDSGDYSLNGNNSDTLSSGNYKFTSWSISGNADLTLEGNVNIYLTETSSKALNISGNGKVIVADGANVTLYTDGKADISGNGVANETTIPENFLLYSTYSGSSKGVKFSGNSDLYGAVYAPDTKVKVTGNGEIFGALVGDEIKFSGNAKLHYDKALQDIDSPVSGSVEISLENWEETY